MMRQAGRHLPEYRELRGRARDFLDFGYSPALAAEATLQPVRRYGMDGAILFADILLVLDAMGRNVRFIEGEGPRVDPATRAKDLANVPMETILARLSPVGETVERVRASLDPSTTLIGLPDRPGRLASMRSRGAAAPTRRTPAGLAMSTQQNLTACSTSSSRQARTTS